ncbi:MAG TPA: glycine/sarcosine/betaine reductase selenoprotein B family protein [Symbiobacteriaceae bacterium]|nr:glycine/sarcosine/betaine reductase selenoprotein B family protein [Symbiobacteriaceae bacterium]
MASLIKLIQHRYWRWKTARMAVAGSGEIPLARLGRPLSQARVALITSGGVHHRYQPPFDCEAGDWTCRQIDGSSDLADLMITHTHYDTADASADLNAIFPLDRLRELAADGVIGSASPVHFGFMGYIPQWAALVQHTGPIMARTLREAGVHAVVASPG